jgi:hypothetical protein
MAQRLFVTIDGRDRKDRILLEVPGDRPVREWIDDLVRVAGGMEAAVYPANGFQLETEEGDRLEGEQSLREAGINSSDVLYLMEREQPVFPAGEGRAPDTAPAADALCLQAIQRRNRWTGPQGLVILFGEGPQTVGRAGKNSAPDIDLSEWDADVIASRKHALLEPSGGGFALRPETTTNGTFLNGVEVPPGESRLLRDGDRVQFGFGGLELVFRGGGAD